MTVRGFVDKTHGLPHCFEAMIMLGFQQRVRLGIAVSFLYHASHRKCRRCQYPCGYGDGLDIVHTYVYM